MPIGILEKEELNWPKRSEGREEVGEERRKLSKNRTVNISRNNVFLHLSEGSIFHLQIYSIILRDSLKK